jgi:hypothetical protein
VRFNVKNKYKWVSIIKTFNKNITIKILMGVP